MTTANKINAVIFGASGGIGSALIRELSKRPDIGEIHAVSRKGTAANGKVTSHAVDMLNEGELAALAQTLKGETAPKLVIIATGLLSGGDLRPEKTYRHQSLSAFEQVFRVNTFGPALIAKHILPIMPRKGRTVFAALSARVGSISDNRSGGWHAYRASKTALNMLLKNYAIEQKFRNSEAVIAGLHPGTVDTGLSKPFQSNLPDGQVITAETSARALLKVIENINPSDSGKTYDWLGTEILP